MFDSSAVVAAKIETVYGTDIVPVAANAILCGSPEIEVIGKKIERNGLVNFFGKMPAIQFGEGVKISFTTELKGSGAAGTAPELGPLFRACNLTQSISAGVSVAYDPNSSTTAAESVSIYFYRHDHLYKISGCRGTFQVDLKATEVGKINWEFTGLYTGPVDSSIITAAPADLAIKPPVFGSASFAVNAVAAIIESLSITMGNNVVKRADVNSASGVGQYMITGREVTGEINPETVALSTINYVSLWAAATAVALTATVGTVAGNKCKIWSKNSSAVIGQPKYGDRENMLIETVPVTFAPSTAGNDEIQFLFT